MIISKKKKIKGLTLLFLVALIPLIYFIIPTNSTEKFINSVENKKINYDQSLKTNLPSPDFEWWNQSWTFRVPVEIKAIGGQQNAPVELFVNFTEYFLDLSVQDPLLNTSTIRVIEYLSSSNYYEVECQFDPYTRSYDNKTNAIGDLIWILNGTTLNGYIRNFFIYFINGTNFEIPEPNYDEIRIWHEGFEEYKSGDILTPTDGQDRQPDLWQISNTTSARGSSSLNIWGNCWKVSYTGLININSDTRVTAKIRLDDPSILREISGLGFHTIDENIPSSQNSYRIRGSQSWGSAGSNKFVNQYYAANTFFWYTFEVDTEITLSSFNYIFYVADDDTPNWLNLYWDDISIWAKPVQTTPNNSLQTTLGDIQPIAYTLKVTCKDEQGNGVPNAHIFITNDQDPSLNQDDYSDVNGEFTFTNIEKDGLYNITVNYTQNGLLNPSTETVFYYENYAITVLNNFLTAYLTITTINFDVTDKDGSPIQYGYTLLKDGSSLDVGKGTLSSSGETTLRWINNTNYNYNVFFDFDALPDTALYRYNELEIARGSVNIGTHDVIIGTEITKVNFNVTQFSDGTPFVGAKLRFYNTTDFNDESKTLANVTVQIDGSARFIFFSNETSGGWGNYTLDVYFGGDIRNFYADTILIPAQDGYNFTLNQEFDVDIEIDLNKDTYNTTLTFIDITSDIYWGDNVTIDFTFTKRDPSEPAAALVTPTELYFRILDDEQLPFSEEVSILSSEISKGIFSYEFNTTQFSLIGGSRYWIEITGEFKSYIPPTPLLKRFDVQAIPTGMKFYDYSLTELIDNEISEYYEEKVNITIEYYNLNSELKLEGATISYSWDYGPGSIIPDPIHQGYYYFEIDTSSSPNVGKYRIDIIATLENYSTIQELFDINILSRPTLINETSTILQKSPQIYVLDAKNYTFVYKDNLTQQIIGDLDIATFNWYKLDENGNPLSGPGNEGTGYLTEDVNMMYVLDFNTELREVGEYSIFITLQKTNYEVRNAFLALRIMKRPIGHLLSATGLSETQDRISIVQGTSILFRLTLNDPLNGSLPLISAKVTLNIGQINYSLIPIGNGIYEYTYSTDNIDAFFLPKTLNGEIIIEKENYETKLISFTIVVGMTEIFPGFPFFYFILLVSGIVAVVGSLATYRLIQIRRIPTFVKKTRAMKKNIKGRKAISESLLYPSKEEYLVKKLGDKWMNIGLSLDDVLGVKEKLKKKASEIKEEFKGGVP